MWDCCEFDLVRPALGSPDGVDPVPGGESVTSWTEVVEADEGRVRGACDWLDLFKDG